MPLSYDDIEEGAELPVHRRTPTTEQVLAFIGSQGGAMRAGGNQFIDAEYAKGMGLPGPIIPGNMKHGFLDQYLRGLFRGEGSIARLQMAMRRPDLHNVEMTIGGTVTRKEESDGKRTAELELFIDNPEGERSVRGAATVTFIEQRKAVG